MILICKGVSPLYGSCPSAPRRCPVSGTDSGHEKYSCTPLYSPSLSSSRRSHVCKKTSSNLQQEFLKKTWIISPYNTRWIFLECPRKLWRALKPSFRSTENEVFSNILFIILSYHYFTFTRISAMTGLQWLNLASFFKQSGKPC